MARYTLNVVQELRNGDVDYYSICVDAGSEEEAIEYVRNEYKDILDVTVDYLESFD